MTETQTAEGARVRERGRDRERESERGADVNSIQPDDAPSLIDPSRLYQKLRV